MIVDDDLAMCSFLRTFLGSRGYEAVALTNADDAIRRFQIERPMAVLLDVVLPGMMDGLAALAAMKRIDRDVPIIVISGQGRTSTVVQSMKLGATDFVSKPFDEAELEVLPGIGEVRAQDIVDSRTNVGPFQDINDLVTRRILSRTIFDRIKARDLPYRSTPTGPTDMQINTRNNGKNLYWNCSDGHVWEILTVSYARPLAAART